MKVKFTLLLIFFSIVTWAQVGVNTSTPNAQFDIRSTNQATPANNDGILIPKVDAFPTINPTAAQQGMLVYLTTTVGLKTKGFYYWDNPTLSWIGLNSSANPDADWFEVATTSAPDAITDDMFHLGRVAIGKNTTSFPLEIDNSTYDTSINNVNSFSGGTSIKIGISNSVTGITNGEKMGIFNALTGTSNVQNFGIYNSLIADGNGNRFGLNSLIGGNGDGGVWGSYNEIVFNGNGTQYGSSNVISGTGTGSRYGFFAQLTGIGSGPQIGSYASLTNDADGLHYGHASFVTGIGLGTKVGSYNEVFGSGNGVHYGVQNKLYGSGAGSHSGIFNELSGIGTGEQTGVYNNITTNNFNIRRGVYNLIGGTTSGPTYGVMNQIGGVGTPTVAGVLTFIANSGDGEQYGENISLTGTGNGTHYGARSSLTGIGTATKYAFYADIPSTAGGTGYGIYSNVLKAGSYSGYFLGNFAIGTAAANTYIMPPSRGTNGQIMQTDGLGNVTWQNPTAVVNAWLVNGNAGSNPATNFVGTTDNVGFAFRTVNVERMRITNTGQIVVNNTVPIAGDIFSSYASGTNFAVNGYSTGSGSAGFFSSTNTGSGLAAYVSGTNSNAADFWTNTGANVASTVDVYNQTGTAPAVAIRSDLANAGADGIELSINGAAAKRGIDTYMNTTVTGIGMTVFHDGTGRCVNFQQQNTANTQPAVFVSSVGSNRTINAQNTTITNTLQVGFFSQNSTGTATATYGNAASVWGQSTGIRSGVFLAGAASANTTCLQGSYSGAVGNYDGVGVFGTFAPNPLYGYGVIGQGNWYGVYAVGDSGASGVKTFQIDHPLDPENKYLRHYSMESPEVLNMYRGNIILDANGEAVVTLPAYFDAININFSYHLTPIGAQANLYVKEEIHGNRFIIAGGQPNQKVSWQVFAERNDLYIQNHPTSKEAELDKKPEDKGLYVQPELYNLPDSKSIFARYKVDPSTVKPETEAKPEHTKSSKKREMKSLPDVQ